MALHQMDLLAHACVTDVVVPSVVLEEQARSRPSYERLRALCQDPAKRFFVFANEHHRDTYVKAEPGESPNDRNDRAIRVVCAFYRRAVPEMRVVLLTNDRGNLRKARDEGVDAVSCREFAKRAASRDPTSEAAGLADLVAPSALDEDELDLEDGAERLQERLRNAPSETKTKNERPRKTKDPARRSFPSRSTCPPRRSPRVSRAGPCTRARSALRGTHRGRAPSRATLWGATFSSRVAAR